MDIPTWGKMVGRNGPSLFGIYEMEENALRVERGNL